MVYEVGAYSRVAHSFLLFCRQPKMQYDISIVAEYELEQAMQGEASKLPMLP